MITEYGASLLGIFGKESGNSPEIETKSGEISLSKGVRFDLATQVLSGPNGPIPLRAQSAAVLAELVAAHGDILSKEHLFRAVWPDTAVTDDSLVKCIADIRRVLGDDKRTLIETLPKVGYRLNIDPPEKLVDMRRSAFGIAAALLLAVLTVVYFWPEPAELPDRPRIAVLAFDDFSTGADQGYLSDGIAEGLITELSRFDEIAVLARASSFSFRGSNASIDEIREALAVLYVLEGSQQKSGDALRVTAQLIDARTGEHVWAHVYDRRIADFFTVQAEIVRAVAANAARKIIKSPLPENDLSRVSALRYYLEARALSSSGQREDFFEALDLSRRAIEVDPEAVFGYVGVADAQRKIATFYSTPEERSKALLDAFTNAEKAVAVDPDSYLGYWLLARIHEERGEIEAAIRRYDQAIALNPSNPDVLTSSSSPLLYEGRFDEGLARIDAALMIDPLHTGWFHWQRAWALWELDRCDEALAAFERMSRVPNPAMRMLAATYACLGRREDAESALGVFLEDNPTATLAAEASKLENTWPNKPSRERWLLHMAFAGMPE